MSSGREAEKEIEEHFAKCINALAERKAVLLKEASHKVTNQSMVTLFLLSSSLSTFLSFFLSNNIRAHREEC